MLDTTITMGPETNKLEVHYVKRADFNTVYSSGVFGGFTPQGNLNIDFFIDRVPIPKKISYVISADEDGVRMNEIERDSKAGFVRECQFGVVMSLTAAIDFRRWLDEQINQYNQVSSGSVDQ